MKKSRISILIAFSSLILLFGCSPSNNHSSNSNSEANNQVSKGELSYYNEMDVAKFTISTIMDYPKEDINVEKDDNNYYKVSYASKVERKRIFFKIKINNRRIVWGNYNGRWRDSNYDETITFFEKEQILTIRQTFNDGSTIDKKFYGK